MQGELLTGAREFCRERSDYIPRILPEEVIGVGQCLTAISSLNDPSMIGQQAPVALYATYGCDLSKNPYIAVWAINPNRETTKLHVLMRGPDSTLIHVTHGRVPSEKALEYMTGRHVKARFVPWEQVWSSSAVGADGQRCLVLGADDPVPYPVDSSVSTCAAVEDRCRGLSNFVPISRLDYAGGGAATSAAADRR